MDGNFGLLLVLCKTSSSIKRGIKLVMQQDTSIKLAGQRVAALSFRLQELRVPMLAMLYNTSSSRYRIFNQIFQRNHLKISPENTGFEIPFNGISILWVRFLRFFSDTTSAQNPRHQHLPQPRSPSSHLPDLSSLLPIPSITFAQSGYPFLVSQFPGFLVAQNFRNFLISVNIRFFLYNRT